MSPQEQAERQRETRLPCGRTSERLAWESMRRRCYETRNPSYHNYGGRGIGVCDRWRHSFAAFLSDMGPKPGAHHSLDRIDNDGNYEPGNCRWATAAQQLRNTRVTRFLSCDGERLPLTDWADRIGLSKHVIHARLKTGWSEEDAIRTSLVPVGHGRGGPRPGETCKAGHPFNESNTWTGPDGRRVCRTCHREASRRRRMRLAAAA